MPRTRRGRKKLTPAAMTLRMLVAVAGVALLASQSIRWLYGPRLWGRVNCWVTVNGRPAREASVFQSGEGTLLVDLRHAPTRADNEGGGYLVQPFWNRVRAISKGYYQIHGWWVIVDEMWMPSVELSPDNPLLKLDPRIEATGDHVAFEGLDHDYIVVHGSLLLPWPER